MPERPKIRRKFRSDLDEANYLNEAITYWLTRTDGRARALRLCQRFEKLLKPRGTDDGSIMLQDHWAVLSEARGELNEAIRFREREIDLIKRLFEVGGPVGPINYHFLSEKMTALARLYEQLEHRRQELVPVGEMTGK